jgi:hypothetical protein
MNRILHVSRRIEGLIWKKYIIVPYKKEFILALQG